MLWQPKIFIPQNKQRKIEIQQENSQVLNYLIFSSSDLTADLPHMTLIVSLENVIVCANIH